MMALKKTLEKLIRRGVVTVIDHEGQSFSAGTRQPDLPNVTVRFTDGAIQRQILMRPQLRFGEAYMEGRMVIEEGDIRDLMELISVNAGTGNAALPFERTQQVINSVVRRLYQLNPASKSQKNVAHHYDLSGKLYDLFLDRDRQYSCAYFAEEGMSLDAAQEAKKELIIRKLRLEPGMKVLDIGSGWGGLGLSIARACPDIEVTGVTLSTEQHALSNKRAEEAGLADRVSFRIQDYRALEGQFDRIVSVGMFEHVGVPHYPEFFQTVSDRLSPDGIALLHSIGRMDGPGSTPPWIRKYIFPGGYVPALSEVLPVIERKELYVTDIEILRLHYAKTLHHWWSRFQENRDKAREIYDERFCRMWEFYLAASEMTFRYRGQMVFHIQMAHRQEAVPLTRDYLFEESGAPVTGDAPPNPRDMAESAAE